MPARSLLLGSLPVLGMAAYTAPSEFVFAGLFPHTGWGIGNECQHAALMAMEEINADTNLLPDTVLKQYWNERTLVADNATLFQGSLLGQVDGQVITDDQCVGSMGVNVLTKQMKDHPEIGAILGSGCSGVCMPAATIAAGYEIPHVSWGCSSPALSDSATYPWFMRLVASDALPISMLTEFMGTAGLKKAGILIDSSGYCKTQQAKFKELWAGQGGSILSEQEAWVQHKLTTEDATERLKKMTEEGVKVMFTCAYPEDDKILKVAAFNLGLNQDKSNLLFAINPPMLDVIKNLPANESKTYAGWVGFMNPPAEESAKKTSYKTNLQTRMKDTKWDPYGDVIYCEYSYDSIYFIADALQSLITSELPASGAHLRKQLLTQESSGITGKVNLESNGDRIVSAALYVINEKGDAVDNFYEFSISTGKSTLADKFAPKASDSPVCEKGSNGESCSGNGDCTQVFTSMSPATLEKKCKCKAGFSGAVCDTKCHVDNGESDVNGVCQCKSKRWFGSDCSQETPEEYNTIPGGMKIVSYLMFIINMASCVFCGLWVFLHRKEKIVKNTQPLFLYILLFGCMLSSSTIIPMGQENTDGKDLSGVNTACAIFPWLYSIGFCVTFGSLFAKILRVYKIFQNASQMKRVTVSIMGMLKYVLIFIVVDSLILCIWTVQDPFKWVRTTISSDVKGYVLSSAGGCESESAGSFLGAIACLHIFLMLYASWLCYASRGISTEFNQSKYVAMAMASNLQVFLLGVPVIVIVGNDPSTSFFVRSAIIFLNDFAVIVFIFGNCLYNFYFGKSSKVASQTAMTSQTQQTKLNA